MSVINGYRIFVPDMKGNPFIYPWKSILMSGLLSALVSCTGSKATQGTGSASVTASNRKLEPQTSSGKATHSSAQSFNGVKSTTGPAGAVSIPGLEWLDPLQFKYAVLLNVEVEQLQNRELLAFLEDWYGTRYRYGGQTKAGVDCSGFTGLLASQIFGVQIPRTSMAQYQFAQRIEASDLREGDLVFFNTRGSVSHVGVYLCNQKFVHASTSGGVMISDLQEPYYKKRWVGAGRIRP
jgi:cell wall-associated NlpC family hydrolase